VNGTPIDSAGSSGSAGGELMTDAEKLLAAEQRRKLEAQKKLAIGHRVINHMVVSIDANKAEIAGDVQFQHVIRKNVSFPKLRTEKTVDVLRALTKAGMEIPNEKKAAAIAVVLAEDLMPLFKNAEDRFNG